MKTRTEAQERALFWRFVLLALALFWGAIAYLVWPAEAAAFDVTLEWDANTEIDLAGYKLYVTQDVNNWPTIPDQTIGYETTTAELTGLADGTWYFGLTAYDWADNESDRAGIAVIWPDGQGPNKPKVKRIHLTTLP